tara:strand:+ start:185 stop:361 length:177 start_codon:yes stop_codon:yes gene_type:complete
MKLSKTNIIIIIYFLGLIFGAIFLDLWSSDTNIKKGLIALTWTAVFLICLFYADRDKE